MMIVPAVEEQSTTDYGSRLSSYALFAERAHIDFNDGSFDEFKTAPLNEVISLTQVYQQDMVLEAHLMMQQPHKVFEDVVKAGFRRAIIQYEIEDDIRDVLEQGTVFDLEFGLAIGPDTKALDIEPYFDLITSVTVMTIHPGKQGQVFLPAMLDKVKELTDGGFIGEIQIDGGMDPLTIKKALEVSPDSFIVGSYLKESDNPEERYLELVSLLPS